MDVYGCPGPLNSLKPNVKAPFTISIKYGISINIVLTACRLYNLCLTEILVFKRAVNNLYNQRKNLEKKIDKIMKQCILQKLCEATHLSACETCQTSR